MSDPDAVTCEQVVAAPPAEVFRWFVDPDLLVHEEFYFNAARLDRSLALSAKDYRAIAEPRVERVSTD